MRPIPNERNASGVWRNSKLPDCTPVKLSISILPELQQRLQDYASAYAKHYGSEEPVVELIPAMLVAFLKSHREYTKYSKGRAV